MYLTDEELKKHNEYCFNVAKLKCEQSEIGKACGITVSMPDHINSGKCRGQIAFPCGIIRDKKKKISAMQARTGGCVMSLAKEKTKYDDLLDPSLKDHTDYAEFVVDNDNEELGKLIVKEPTPEVSAVTVQTSMDPIFKKGILDLC